MTASAWASLVLSEPYQSEFLSQFTVPKMSGWCHDSVKLPDSKSQLLSAQQKIDVLCLSSKGAALFYYSSRARLSPWGCLGLPGEAHPSFKRCKTWKTSRCFLMPLCMREFVVEMSKCCLSGVNFWSLQTPFSQLLSWDVKSQVSIWLITEAGLSKELFSPDYFIWIRAHSGKH